MLSPIYSTTFVPKTVPGKLNVKPDVKTFKNYGDLPPLNYFDPLNLATEKNAQYLREFELQHGRTAMIAATLIPLYELMKPGELGIKYLSDMDLGMQLPFWYVMALLEFGRMKKAWENPFTGGNLFTLKKDFQPGNYLDFKVENVSERAYNSELNNGRLAMLAVAHMIGSELVSGQTLF